MAAVVKIILRTRLGINAQLRNHVKLNAQTGVVYTQTSSDFTYQYGSGQMVVNQSLHYVGIPVGLSYEVWGISRLHTYVNVGGEGSEAADLAATICGSAVERDTGRTAFLV